MTFDELRAANPDLAVSLYALEPGGLVTLEILTPDGQSFTFAAETAAAAIEEAFPTEPGISIEVVDRVDCPNTGLPCLPQCNGKICLGMHLPINQWPAATPEPEPNVFD